MIIPSRVNQSEEWRWYRQEKDVETAETNLGHSKIVNQKNKRWKGNNKRKRKRRDQIWRLDCVVKSWGKERTRHSEGTGVVAQLGKLIQMGPGLESGRGVAIENNSKKKRKDERRDLKRKGGLAESTRNRTNPFIVSYWRQHWWASIWGRVGNILNYRRFFIRLCCISVSLQLFISFLSHYFPSSCRPRDLWCVDPLLFLTLCSRTSSYHIF